MKSQKIAFTLALLTAGLTAQEAVAEVDVEPTALALFEQGVLSAEAARWDEALVLFRRSSALSPRRLTEFNEASALYHLERFEEAAHTFQAYLRHLDTRDAPSTLRDAERYLAECERALDAKPTPSPEPMPAAATSAIAAIASAPVPTRTLPRATASAHPPTAEEARASVAPGPEPLRESSPRGAQISDAGRTDSPRTGASTGTPAAPLPTLGKSALPEIPALAPPTLPPRPSTSLVESPLFWAVTGAILVGTGVVLGFALRPGEAALEAELDPPA